LQATPQNLGSTIVGLGFLNVLTIRRVGTALVGGADFGKSAGEESVNSHIAVEPLEAGNLSDLGGLGSQLRRQAGDGQSVHLGRVVGVGPKLDTRERVAVVAGRARGAARDGGRRGSSRHRGIRGGRADRRSAGGAGAGGPSRGASRAGLSLTGNALAVPVIQVSANTAGLAAGRAVVIDATALTPKTQTCQHQHP